MSTRMTRRRRCICQFNSVRIQKGFFFLPSFQEAIAAVAVAAAARGVGAGRRVLLVLLVGDRRRRDVGLLLARRRVRCGARRWIAYTTGRRTTMRSGFKNQSGLTLASS
jgi:hypothetical protein